MGNTSSLLSFPSAVWPTPSPSTRPAAFHLVGALVPPRWMVISAASQPTSTSRLLQATTHRSALLPTWTWTWTCQLALSLLPPTRCPPTPIMLIQTPSAVKKIRPAPRHPHKAALVVYGQACTNSKQRLRLKHKHKCRSGNS